MRLLFKLAVKFALMLAMVVVMGGLMRRGSNFMTKVPGMPEEAKFSSEESDLMSTVFQSAVRLFTGQAKKEELASELSDKLYAGRADAGDMAELGIELVKPGGASPLGDATGGAKAKPGAAAPKAANGAPLSKGPTGATPAKGLPGSLPAKPGTPVGQSAMDRLASGGHVALPPGLWGRLKPYSIELGLVPVMFLGMILVQRMRGRHSKADAFMIPTVGVLPPAEMEPFEMKNAVHSLGTEEFELLVALIYQRQGYRVSMPAGLSGGRGGDFTLLRKAEKVLVQCKRLSADHRVPVERVRELLEAMGTAGATRGLYVASCGFTWDARNFAKSKGVTLISARTLDELINTARERPDENLLAVSEWIPKFLTKLQLTPPQCPLCEAAMEQINASNGAVWVCSQRPDCKGRRSGRKYQKAVPPPAHKSELPADEVGASAKSVWPESA